VSVPYGDKFAEPPGSPASGQAEAATGQPGLVAGIQQRQAERDRLLNLCQQLRRQHRCPGRCVFTGELRRSGVSMFRSMLDDSA